MSQISPAAVLGRALIALGLALLLGGVIGGLIGAKTSVSMEGSASLPRNGALVISLYTLTSSGTVRIEVWNASTAYYIAGIKGDPRSLVKGLQAFNITSAGQSYRTDMRLGIVYGTATVRAGKGILGALPVISQALHFNIHQLRPEGEGHYVLETRIGVNEAILFFAVGGNVKYRMTYTVEGSPILPPRTVSATGMALATAGIVVVRLLAARRPG